MSLSRGAVSAWIVVAGVALAACGDAETKDTRGYTKAPLEDPGLTVRAEQGTLMDELGDPVLPAVVEPSELGAAGGTPSGE